MQKKKPGRPKKIHKEKYVQRCDEEVVIQNDSLFKKLYNNIKKMLKKE